MCRPRDPRLRLRRLRRRRHRCLRRSSSQRRCLRLRLRRVSSWGLSGRRSGSARARTTPPEEVRGATRSRLVRAAMPRSRPTRSARGRPRDAFASATLPLRAPRACRSLPSPREGNASAVTAWGSVTSNGPRTPRRETDGAFSFPHLAPHAAARRSRALNRRSGLVSRAPVFRRAVRASRRAVQPAGAAGAISSRAQVRAQPVPRPAEWSRFGLLGGRGGVTPPARNQRVGATDSWVSWPRAAEVGKNTDSSSDVRSRSGKGPRRPQGLRRRAPVFGRAGGGA